MPRHDEIDDDEAGEEFDPEGPDPSEMDSSDDPDLEVCPHCRKLIYEDAERCPHCGEYVNPSDAPLSKGAWVVVTVVILLLISSLLWIF